MISDEVLKGIFPVIPTMFAEDDLLDLDAQRKVVRFALDAGCNGVVFPGVASEHSFLTSAERDEVMAIVAEEVNGSVPIVGGASAATVDEAVAAGLQARKHGIHHLMIMAPNGIGSDIGSHCSFFADILASIRGIEVILQNAPSPTGAGLAPAEVATLAASNAAITYVKEETLPSGPAISSLLGSQIQHLKGVFGGGGARYIVDELDRGALGAMPAVELTDLHVALFDAHARGDHARSRELYRLSLPLLVSQAIYRMRLSKYVLSQRGIAHALRVRAPLPDFDTSTRRDIDHMLSDLRSAFP